MADILLLLAHPDLQHSRVHAALRRALAPEAGARWVLHDLYARYPDYLIDVRAEQAALERARLVVWLHPIHWYGMPPLLKLWLDEVFAYGWAYGPGGTRLAGKDLWLVVSTGGSEASYRPAGHNGFFIDAFWPPYEQTAQLAGMRFLPPLVLHGAHQVSPSEIDAHAELLIERLRSWPDWPEIAELAPCVQGDAPADERPTAEPLALARA
ncbi:MAG: NAD(P)H-dependent oxidoreductase [Ideonella sp.]|nr:NAD(P)H-dependent oxidoreductase [Ideonella sp.]MCC7456759.1 NAD(P)H-dependent oxidoreductase [Nitrospira sp.]